ncbi:hypothetical protein GFM12_06420 [Pseudomonas aeruginosa]|uniref:hypothetical protein n=1 Tax=Pseudomonas aeruginosa TaxID=287 RepID=UPI00190CCB51|nr:hypothetical protein [Pseudomonas aeruginosa]MBK3752180.1 hypothetical protein [Pseudomonas aeruginosa]MBK3762418.1 hypothetical protein [Pseudomonas aeruginosa]MBK3768958.1 hypothetical protein [Pseudomonas aeruginosa]MBK3789146.1 hypothetical protein [Pseudomonas aeruginosa]MBK3885192.1 hypothetical protein [Pseudomonas aeruginosa]
MGEVAKFIGYAFLVLVALGIYGQWKDGKLTLFSKANCRIISVNHFAETFVTNGNFDFGYVVQTKIQNVGGEGKITVKAYLSSSEGNLERSQVLVFPANTERVLQYQFAEPSLNATGVQSRLECSPSKAKKA